jgi:hypothetical protein
VRRGFFGAHASNKSALAKEALDVAPLVLAI